MMTNSPPKPLSRTIELWDAGPITPRLQLRRPTGVHISELLGHSAPDARQDTDWQDASTARPSNQNMGILTVLAAMDYSVTSGRSGHSLTMSGPTVNSNNPVVLMIKLTILFLLLAMTCRGAITDRQAVESIIGESASEPFLTKLAIAGALRNRGMIAGVRGYHNQGMIQRQPKFVWNDANRAWRQSATNDLSKGGTFFESDNFTKPKWAYGMVQTAKVGKFTFFRLLTPAEAIGRGKL